MNRLQKRAAIFDTVCTIPELCQQLHESTSGSGDFNRDEELIKVYLKECLATWQLPESGYDVMVRHLILEVLK